jgi:vacuolar protein sorting-associated protein 52
MAMATASAGDVNLEEIDFDELDDYLELFQQDGVIKEALQQGVDLRQYAAQIDQELRAAEIDSVSQYVLKSADIVELHDQVQECDNILAKMQEMLLGFQADLGGISDEIRQLQDESIGMNVKLKNRKETEDQLKQYLDNVVLAPSLVKTIDEGDVTDAYLHALVALNGKLKYAAMRSPDPAGSSFDLVPMNTAAFKEVEAQLHKLKSRAVTRVREYLWSKMNDIKKPKTNVQMMQQNTLSPMKYLVMFLADNAPEVEEEFREIYAETMSKTLTTVFKSYHAGLLRFHEEVATRTDLIAVEEQSLKGLFSTKVNLSKRKDTFAIGEREKILENAAAPPLILHVASQENHKLPYEAVFRNVQQHLMNSATSEYLFIIDFFRAGRDENVLRSRDLFLRVFAKTLSLCLENLENYLFTCYDAVGLLLMIRLTHSQRLVMEKRRIPCLDSYFDRVTLLLWPRFKAVFELNLMSVKNAKVKKLGAIDLHPHYVVRRYAEFAASVLSLSLYTQSPSSSSGHHGTDPDDARSSISSAQMHDNGAGDMVLHSLALLRDEMLALLARLAEQHKSSKDRCVFLVNNYDLVLSQFQDKHILSDETSKIEILLAAQREKFVEEELMTWYGKMLVFVRQNEAAVLGRTASGTIGGAGAVAASQYEVDTAQIERIVREFAATWKSGIEKMNGNIMKYFSNFRNGMEILKQVLTQLLLYYTRFIDIVKKTYQTRGGNAPFSNDIVTTQEILYEIKKYSRSF